MNLPAGSRVCKYVNCGADIHVHFYCRYTPLGEDAGHCSAPCCTGEKSTLFGTVDCSGECEPDGNFEFA